MCFLLGFLCTALIRAGCIVFCWGGVEGRSPPQKRGRHRRPGSRHALAAVNRDRSGQIEPAAALKYVISGAGRGGEDRPEGTHLWRVVAPSRENLAGHVVGTYPVHEHWKAAALSGAETVFRLG